MEPGLLATAREFRFHVTPTRTIFADIDVPSRRREAGPYFTLRHVASLTRRRTATPTAEMSDRPVRGPARTDCGGERDVLLTDDTNVRLETFSRS